MTPWTQRDEHCRLLIIASYANETISVLPERRQESSFISNFHYTCPIHGNARLIANSSLNSFAYRTQTCRRIKKTTATVARVSIKSMTGIIARKQPNFIKYLLFWFLFPHREEEEEKNY